MPNLFNEDTLEQMVIDTIKNNGWKYVDSVSLDRQLNDVLVESMVKDALIRLNPEIAANPSYADQVIYKLRALILSVRSNNLITQNEEFKKLIFERNSFPFGENGRNIPIKFFGTTANGLLDQNEYIVTNQWSYQSDSSTTKRFDVVMLINGFPVVIGELKTPVRNASSWIDAVQDLHDYEKSVPQMFVTNILEFATEGKMFRYSSIGAPINVWGPWHTNGHSSEGTLSDVSTSITDMFKPSIIMDIFQFFTIFATDSHSTKYKVVCRYQQYEGANLIVERVIKGYPKKGLIWHFQGSGKSLLMVFAAQKLRMMKELNAPTVVVVEDRIDLDTQITATFNSADVPNMEKATTKEELENFFKSDKKKILLTKIFEFGDVTETLNYRDNIIVMVDEAHRTQEGNLGEKMRLALPNAFFFGLTGTPINKLDKNTFRTFGAVEDKSGYLSKYTFADSVRDGATLELHFEPVPVELHVNKEIIDEEFDNLAKEAGLSEAEKGDVASRVRIEAIMKSTDRIKKVCEHIANHFMDKVQPNGFKAQVVCYDRECCVLYKKELDKWLGEYTSTIVMDTNNDKEDKYKEWRRSKDEEAKILDRFRDPADPLEIVIVTSKLLTGFDAPILQTMYLDKPMKDHTLLQAICRTNRTYGDSKDHGLIVDYVGIFDDVANALNFDENSIQKVITNIDRVKDKFPELMTKCLSYFPCVDRTSTDWESLVNAQDCLKDNKERDQFGADYRVLNKAYSALSPDPFLYQYKDDYKWLSMVYESLKPTDGRGGLIWAALGPKTLELINQNIHVENVNDDEDIIELDAGLLDDFIEGKKDAGKKVKKLEIDLVARILKHGDNPIFIDLGKRLEELRDKHAQGLIDSVEFLKSLLDLAKDVSIAEQIVPEESSLDRGKAALTELFNNVKNDKTPVAVARIVEDIDGIVNIVRFDGWQDTVAGRREVKKALRSIVAVKYKIKDQEVFDKAYKYIETYY